ncbi:uncharacterized protein LOC124371457 [Homalodisca vitripennis]|uniref:uncharacterized protein LOC124371457 n=1 Tax=Homalodisca vitripennis TaxID=197043 RepID=UPI001EEA7DCF|nr:uncharacterized protein LOC124371457 [Homalodisca vitripennis]
MAKPDSPEGGGGGTRGLLAGLCVALGAVVALAVCVAYLDGRRQEQLSELTGQLETLRLLVDSMQKQLEQHEDKINSTLHAKSTVSGGVADEVIYEEEEEYDYDSYEYDDEEEPSPKATVKRTTILSESDGERNSTATDISTPSRTRRDVSSQSVPQRDESTTEPLEDPTEGNYKTTASYNRRQLNSYRSPEYQVSNSIMDINELKHSEHITSIYCN